jgi:hypothetical protein
VPSLSSKTNLVEQSIKNFSIMLTPPLLPRILRYTALSLSPLLLASSAMAAGFTALSGDYYNGYFNGSPGHFTSNTKAFTRQDSFIAFTDPLFRADYPNTPPNAGYVDWGFAGTPLNGVSEFFSVRWTGELQIDQAGTYSFRTLSDDGIIAYLDNASIISNPSIHSPLYNTVTLSLTAGSHPFQLLYGENTDHSVALLQWQKPGDTSFSTILRQPVTQTPGPLPLLGLAAAFKTSRNVRRRLRSRVG